MSFVPIRAAFALLLPIVAVAQTPPRTLAGIPRSAGVDGPLRIWTYAHGTPTEKTGSATAPGTYHGIEHPFATWTVGAHTVNGPFETWTGCSVPGRSGTFDIRKTTAPVDPHLALVAWEVRPAFSPGSGVAVHRFRFVERLDPALPGISSGESRVLLPATGSVWVRDAVANLTRERADNELGAELGFRPYWRDSTNPATGLYFNRLNIADVLSVHAFDTADAPAWGLGVYVLDPGNAQAGHLLVGSNPDAAERASLEIGYDVVLTADHLENNGLGGAWSMVALLGYRSLPSVTPKEYAWWEHVDFVRTILLAPLYWLGDPPPLTTTPAWARTAMLGVGYGVDDFDGARREALRIRSFFRKYDRMTVVAPEFHYVPSFTSWTDELYTTPMRPAFRDLVSRVRSMPARYASRAHVLTYLATSFYVASDPEPPHPLAGTRALNDRNEPYGGPGNQWFVDPSDPAYVAAFDQAVQTLMAEGVEGAYFDALFGETLRNYGTHLGADPNNHLDQVTLVDRARYVHGWNAMFVGEQSRLGNRYAVGAFLPCGLRAIPGGSVVPFVDALVHDHRLTVGAGDILEQWFAHVKFGVRGVANPTKHDVQNIAHDYVFGFVKGQLVIDGRTEYEAAPGAPEPVVRIQIFEADPALQPLGADPLEVLGFEVLKDVADLLYPRMMWWRATTPALQSGRMLVPLYPTATVAGQPVDEWFVLQKEYFFKTPNFPAPPGSTSDYETERYPVSFWAEPADPNRLTLFMGNPTYDAVDLQFVLDAADRPVEMGTSDWRLTLDPLPEDPPGSLPTLNLGPARHFEFTVRVQPFAFARVTLRRA
ncbi:MAG: hypothetical protein IPM29_26595 [Planctomycetes bacterium]|nr:hypothetical protein [Planctomycetota bacterium]